jgi:3-isopropylmalate dehydrogenase
MASSTHFNIAVIPGDGIGQEVVPAALDVLKAVQQKTGGFELIVEILPMGAGHFRDTGVEMPAETFEKAEAADAILLGAIGLPNVRRPDGTEISPHLRLREAFGLYAGVRPVKAYPNAPQRLADTRAKNIDLVIVRESTEGLFYTQGRGEIVDDREAQETLRITRQTCEKLFDFSFRLAQRRKARGKRGLVTCVDKANVFRAFAFFRKIFNERREQFRDIETGYNYVDAQALDLIRRPWDFDVLVMENMFGDILSDLGGGLVGGMGMAACGEIGDEHALFQPAHGSAPDIIGQDKANPLATILSGALMLDWLSQRSGKESLAQAAQLIEGSVERGFAENRLRPMEFGGDQGAAAIAHELIEIISESADSPD